MDIANRWADAEDSVHRAQSEEEDDYGRRRERRNKRRPRVYDDRDGPDMVAAGYADRCNDANRNSGGYRGGNFRDGGQHSRGNAAIAITSPQHTKNFWVHAPSTSTST